VSAPLAPEGRQTQLEPRRQVPQVAAALRMQARGLPQVVPPEAAVLKRAAEQRAARAR
jgi:hypothetical protein